jgi:hypothetical protein
MDIKYLESLSNIAVGVTAVVGTILILIQISLLRKQFGFQ